MTGLLSLPPETIERICAPLVWPLAGIYVSRLTREEWQEHCDRFRDLLNFSLVCKTLRTVATPYLLRTIELPNASDWDSAPLRRVLQHKPNAESVKSVIVGANCSEAPVRGGSSETFSLFDPLDIFDDDDDVPDNYGAARPDIELLLETMLPYAKRLHFSRWSCNAATYANLVSSSVETLILDDDFVLLQEAAGEAHFDITQRQRGEGAPSKLRHLQISTPPEYTLRSRPDVLQPFISFAAQSRVFEYLNVRTYRSRLGINVIPSSLWATLRTLALDAGEAPESGFAELFADFKAYRAAQPAGSVPLQDLILETRTGSMQLWTHIIDCLAGHRVLKRLSICVLPAFEPEFLYQVEHALPDLRQLHILAFHKRVGAWHTASYPAWAEALSRFKHLEMFGFNDLRGASILTRHLPARLTSFAVYVHYGTTHYEANVFTRPAAGVLCDAKGERRVTFFPIAPPDLVFD